MFRAPRTKANARICIVLDKKLVAGFSRRPGTILLVGRRTAWRLLCNQPRARRVTEPTPFQQPCTVRQRFIPQRISLLSPRGPSLSLFGELARLFWLCPSTGSACSACSLDSRPAKVSATLHPVSGLGSQSHRRRATTRGTLTSLFKSGAVSPLGSCAVTR